MLSPKDKALTLGTSVDQIIDLSGKGENECENGNAFFLGQELNKHTCVSILLRDFNVTSVVDLSPGSGAVAIHVEPLKWLQKE